MPKRSSKLPEDENKAAFDAVHHLTGEDEAQPHDADNRDAEARRQAARLLGSLGGKKGGPARAKKLSKERRSEIAGKAARSRWKRQKKA